MHFGSTKNLASNVNHILKKSYNIEKLLKDQIKYELQFTNLPFSEKNQFRLLIQSKPTDAHSTTLLLYKKFEDKSLVKNYEMFIKTDVSKILHTDYSTEPEKSYERFKKYVKNYYDKKTDNGDNEAQFMTIDKDEYDEIDNLKTENDSVPDDNEHNNRDEHLHDTEMKKRIDQLEEFNDENSNMVSFFDEFFNGHNSKNMKEIENPFENIYASQFIPVEIIIRDANNVKHEMLITSLLDLANMKLFVEKIAVLAKDSTETQDTGIIIPEWFENNTDAKKLLLKKKYNLGPDFVYFDPKIQNSLYELLKSWGIVENNKFISDIYEKAEEREQVLYLAWLFQLNDYFSKHNKSK